MFRVFIAITDDITHDHLIIRHWTQKAALRETANATQSVNVYRNPMAALSMFPIDSRRSVCV